MFLKFFRHLSRLIGPQHSTFKKRSFGNIDSGNQGVLGNFFTREEWGEVFGIQVMKRDLVTVGFFQPLAENPG